MIFREIKNAKHIPRPKLPPGGRNWQLFYPKGEREKKIKLRERVSQTEKECVRDRSRKKQK